MIWTPDVTRVCSKRGFDGLVSTILVNGSVSFTEHAYVA